MGLLKAWLGPDFTGEMRDGTGQIMLASRRINVSDVLEVQAQLKKTFPRVEIVQAVQNGWGPGAPLVEPLDEASDQVLRALAVQAWVRSEYPSFTIRLGPDVQNDAHLGLVHERVDGVDADELARLEVSASVAVHTLARAGHRILSARHWAHLAGVVVAIIYLALLAWFAASVRPQVVWVVVLGLALIPTALLGYRKLLKLTSRLGHHQVDRILVDHVTRDEWRRQRYDRKKDWKSRGLGFVVGLAASAGAAWLARALGF